VLRYLKNTECCNHFDSLGIQYFVVAVVLFNLKILFSNISNGFPFCHLIYEILVVDDELLLSNEVTETAAINKIFDCLIYFLLSLL
jgi:hypothetical protein